MTTNVADLSLYLDEAGRRPWSWTQFNCLFFIGEWIERVAGFDPSRPWRGTFCNQREARRIIRASGGIDVIVGNALIESGFHETAVPQRGDVGLVRVPIIHRGHRLVIVPSGAICVRAGAQLMWAVKPRDGGIALNSFPIVKAWALEPMI